MITRLDPPLPVEVAGRQAMAYAWVDYGTDHDLLWLVAYDDSREFWMVSNKAVRAVENLTFGRRKREGGVQDRREGSQPGGFPGWQ